MIKYLFIVPILTTLCLSFVYKFNYKLWMFSKTSNSFNRFRSLIHNYSKQFVLISLFINLFYSLYLWKYYPVFSGGEWLYSSNVILNSVIVFDVSNNLSLIFIILSTFVLIVSVLAAWNTTVDFVLFCILILLVEIFLIGAFSCTNIFVFLLFFEASALPIFILIVYCGSARRERIKASYYFIFFTLYGSLSLLLTILVFFSLGQIDFSVSQNVLSDNHTLWLLLFISFAVKIPLFPFHMWLPYAHVEASTSSSIILAALMLKLGGFGLVKFMLPLFSVETHLFFRPLALFVCVLGVIYGGICAIRQIDLKRQVAFSSISHMSFSTLGIFSFTESGVKGAVYLMLSHGLTSSALFFLVGVLSDRYHTRSIFAYSGLLGSMPVFSFFLILGSLANVGFPGTSGFLPELIVLVAVMSSVPAILFPTLLGMLFTTGGTLVVLLRMLFGHHKASYFKSHWVDVTKLEFFIASALSMWILMLGLLDVTILV